MGEEEGSATSSSQQAVTRWTGVVAKEAAWYAYNRTTDAQWEKLRHDVGLCPVCPACGLTCSMGCCPPPLLLWVALSLSNSLEMMNMLSTPMARMRKGTTSQMMSVVCRPNSDSALSQAGGEGPEVSMHSQMRREGRLGEGAA